MKKRTSSRTPTWFGPKEPLTQQLAPVEVRPGRFTPSKRMPSREAFEAAYESTVSSTDDVSPVAAKLATVWTLGSLRAAL